MTLSSSMPPLPIGPPVGKARSCGGDVLDIATIRSNYGDPLIVHKYDPTVGAPYRILREYVEICDRRHLRPIASNLVDIDKWVVSVIPGEGDPFRNRRPRRIDVGVARLRVWIDHEPSQ